MKRLLALSVLALVSATCLFSPSAVNSQIFYKEYANIEKVGTAYEACKELVMVNKLLLRWVVKTKDDSQAYRDKSVELKLIQELLQNKRILVWKHMGITYEMVDRNREEDPRKTLKMGHAYCKGLVKENVY